MELRFEKVLSGRIKCGRMEQNCLEGKKRATYKKIQNILTAKTEMQKLRVFSDMTLLKSILTSLTQLISMKLNW